MPYLKTLGDQLKGSLSPDDMKVSQIGLNALTRSQAGTGGTAPMPKARRKLFTQNYYKGSHPHADNTLGDPFGTMTRREETTGGRI
jgi:hypothetical protein